MLALVLLLATAPAEPAAAEKPKLLVLDFRDDGVGANVARVVHDTLTSHVSKNEKLDVISSEDMRRALDVEASKVAMGGCSDESCLAEIAGALGAQLTLYGTVGKLGELVLVNISLYDARENRSVGRETIESKNLEELPGAVRAAADRLIARIPGLAPPSSSWAPGVVFWSGAGVGVAGLVAGVAGLVVGLANTNAVKEAPTFDEKSSAARARDAGFGVAVAGAVVGALGLALLPLSLVVE
jgi:TolB-like protein